MADNAQNVYAYQDAVDLLVDWLGGNADAAASRDIRRAVLEAYDELCGERQWSHFTRVHQLELQAPVDGTLAYSESTNLFTIDGADTWPTWAEGATLSVGDVRYRIATRNSSTTLTPVSGNTPIADIATGTAFNLYKGIYTLPENFISLVEPLDETNVSIDARYCPADEWAFYDRYDESTGSVCIWTIMADPNNLGRQAIHLYPAPDSNRTLAFLGRFYPRAIRLTGYRTEESVGTVSLSGNTATGTNTTFSDSMIGSLIRVSPSATAAPDGIGGNTPYAYQRIITAVASTTSLTFGGDAVSTSGKKYRITDPLDISRPMVDALWRACEAKVAHKKGTSQIEPSLVAARIALQKARENDDHQPSGKQSCWDRRTTRSQWLQSDEVVE